MALTSGATFYECAPGSKGESVVWTEKSKHSSLEEKHHV